MTSIRGRTAVVIGASSAVGRATVHALVEQEARAVAVARGEGTNIGNDAAAAIVGSLRGDVAQGVTAIEVTGLGVAPLG